MAFSGTGNGARKYLVTREIYNGKILLACMSNSAVKVEASKCQAHVVDRHYLNEISDVHVSGTEVAHQLSSAVSMRSAMALP